jgi:hypothetical protein
MTLIVAETDAANIDWENEKRSVFLSRRGKKNDWNDSMTMPRCTYFGPQWVIAKLTQEKLPEARGTGIDLV